MRSHLTSDAIADARPGRRILVAAGAIVVAFMVASASAAAGVVSKASNTGVWTPEQVLTELVRIDQGNSPQLQVTRDGTAIAVWREMPRGIHGDRLVVATKAADDATWSDPLVVAHNTFYNDLAVHGRNHATVAWQSLSGGQATISSRTMHSDGTWGPVRQIAAWERTVGGTLVSLEIAANAAGDMVAFWTRGKYIRASYRSAGHGWQAAVTIPVVNAYAYSAIANVSLTGAVDVAFPAPGVSGRDAIFAYHRSIGGAWGGRQIAPTPAAPRLAPADFGAAGNANGDFIVSWSERTAVDAPWTAMSRSRTPGVGYSAAETMATHATYPQVDLSAAGDASGVWVRRDAGNELVEWAEHPSGGAWSNVQLLGSKPVSPVGFPQFSIDVNALGDSVVHFLGRHETTPGTFVDDHRVVRCPVTELCGPAYLLRGPSGYEDAVVAANPDGGAVAVWTNGCATEECIPTSVRSRQLLPS